ncbi:FtsX-like permease family protein [Paractinoplanes atraurantiacus]|nr:FtsX-like permease family protein [Actinoplanes atraurantiacus]
MDRLTGAALLGGVRQRAWSLLITAAFLVLGAAGAAGPFFAEASDNAAFQVGRDAVSSTARQTDAAVVRLSAPVGRASADHQQVLDDLRRIPHLTPPDLTGGSIGAELIAPTFWGSTASFGGVSERGRLFAVSSPAAELDGTAHGQGGLWIPQPMASSLGVKPGETITVKVTVGTAGRSRSATARVDGVYAVDAGGRLPAGPSWPLRQGDTPPDTEYETLPSYLLIGDVPTIEKLAREVDDEIFWAAEAALTPGVTLAEAQRTANEVEWLRRGYASGLEFGQDSPRSMRFASGISQLVTDARATSGAVEQRTRPVEWSAIAVGLASVLAVALLSARRRDREIRHAVAVGIAPARVGGLWLLEHLLPAALGVALGWLAAWQLVARLGPPGALAESYGPAATSSATAVLVGVVAVAGVGAASASRRVRPAPPVAVRRKLPWTTMLVLVALTAAGGLAGASDAAGGVDLLVPLLVLVAIGGIAGWLPGLLAGRSHLSTSPADGASRRSTPVAGAGPAVRPASRPGRAGVPVSPAGPADTPLSAAGRPVSSGRGRNGPVRGLPSSPGRGVLWLARRRLGEAGAERRLAVLVMTAGLGMLLFALAAVDSTQVAADDRVAVAAGAEAVATLEGSWEIDPTATPVPAEDPTKPPPEGPVPGVHSPVLPPGSAVVWRTDVETPVDSTQKDLLIVDPARFRDVALWGSGPDLAAARKALAVLEAAPADEIGHPRAIAVGDPATDQIDSVRINIGYAVGDLTIAARVPAFPGMEGRPMYVVAHDPILGSLGIDDPRLKPRNRQANVLFPQAYLYATGAPGIQAVIAPVQVQPARIDGAAKLRQDAAYVASSRARGYQLAVAGYLALLAVLTLCIYAQRTATLRRPADLMLARVGLGAARVRRARALEFVLLTAVALAAAVAGVAALARLGPRLLDDQPGLLPRFAFQIPASALLITASAAVVASILAIWVSSARSPHTEEDAYRDD